MPEDQAGESRYDTIMQRRGEVFGPSCDSLVREIGALVPEAEREGFRVLVDGWTEGADALFAGLVEMRRSAGPPVGGSMRGSVGGGVWGMVVGGLAGLPLGGVVYLVALQLAIPTEHWSSEAVMWGVVLAVAGAAALAGLRQGLVPSRLGRAVMRGLGGFLVGGIVAALVTGVVVGAVAGMVGVSQREGAFAMGLVFGLMPLAGLVGGAVTGVWMGRRAWMAPAASGG